MNKIDDFFKPETAEKFIERQKRRGFLIVAEDGKQKLKMPDGHGAWVQPLDPYQMMEGGHCGINRWGHSRLDNLTDRLQGDLKDDPMKKWGIEVESACAEKAVSVFTDRDWNSSPNKFQRGGDVGNWTQVRWCPHNDRGLIYRPRNPINKPYVCVTGSMGWYLIHGWVWGFKAIQRPQTWADSPNPAWVVDQDQLQPMETLPPEPGYEVKKDVSDAELRAIMGWSEEEHQRIIDE